MKKLGTLLVLVALGATTQSCNDESFNEVEQTVMENDVSSITVHGEDDEKDKPGQQ